MSEGHQQQHEVYYSGRVQGVGFRYTARSLAARFQLTGFVRNLPDGRVCLVVEGEKSQIEGLLGEIQAEMNPYIGNVQKMERPATGQFQSFEIRH